MKMPLKTASWTEKLLHDGTLAALALFPFFQTAWTEKPWWVKDRVVAPAEASLGQAAEAPMVGQAVEQAPVWAHQEQEPASEPAPDHHHGSGCYRHHRHPTPAA